METKAKTPARPADLLRAIFTQRKDRNPAYSISAFARDLGMSQSLLSRVLNGSRNLSLNQAIRVASLLGFSPEENREFIRNVVASAPEKAKIARATRKRLLNEAIDAASDEARPFVFNWDVERFNAIARWYHLAILNLTETEDFVSQSEWIAERLRITRAEVEDAIFRLTELGLLEKVEGKLTRTKKSLYIQTEKSELAVRTFHKEMIDKAKAQLDLKSKSDYDARSITGITFAVSREKALEFQKHIDLFEDRILSEAEESPGQEVYQMNVQLFPLTQLKTGESA